MVRGHTIYDLSQGFKGADGDTIKVIFNGQTERVRILDIDAPEVRRGSKLQQQASKAGVSEDTMLERGQER